MNAESASLRESFRFTGIGSLPAALGFNSDSRTFAATLFHERSVELAAGLPYLAEAPDRGVGADMIGRTLAMAAGIDRDFAASLGPSGWRRSAPGQDMESAAGILSADVDAFCAVITGLGEPVKMQVAGPFTTASMLEGANGERMISDRTFVVDLATVIAEASAQIAEAIRRLSGVPKVIVQVDEPMLPQVVGGKVPTASGLHRHRAVSAAEATALLSTTVAGIGADVWVHCCAGDAPVEVMRGSGARGISIDIRAVSPDVLDVLGEAVDAGLDLVLGVLHPEQWGLPARQLESVALAAADRLRVRLGFDEQTWLERTVLTPSCGLAGASAVQARAVMHALQTASASLAGGTIGDIDM